MVIKKSVEPKSIYQEVGRNIRRLRKESGYTQDRISGQAGISRASLANIEAGRQQILVHHLYAIADALQLDSPIQLLPVAPSFSPPVSDEGLTKLQRKQVIGLMSKG